FCPENARPWLPVPESWGELSREAQRGTEGSALELYTRALRLRRELDALGDGSMAWLSAPTGVLFFEREPGIRCAVNLTGETVELPTSGEVLISSGPVTADRKSLSLPSDTAVWLRVATFLWWRRAPAPRHPPATPPELPPLLAPRWPPPRPGPRPSPSQTPTMPLALL